MTKAEKFRDLATKRIRYAVGALRRLQRCSNRNVYEYSDREVIRMLGTLRLELARLEAAFSAPPEEFDFSQDHQDGILDMFEEVMTGNGD